MTSNRAGKRYFSLMYVPDHEGDPKSVLMSYFQGRLVLIALVILGIHIVLGAAGYYYIAKLRGQRSVLKSQVYSLTAENKQIERIVREFEIIKERDQRIRQALGSTLGVQPRSPEEWEQAIAATQEAGESLNVPLNNQSQVTPPLNRPREGLYRLVERESGYDGPEYLPTLLPVSGYVTSHFQKGSWYMGRNHWGIDIAGSKGTSINASGAGVVLLANWTPDFGNMIIISHGNGLYSYYGHAMRLLVEQGTRVRKGQVIAQMGSSGISSAAHLHFEIWKDGSPLDPEDYLFALAR